MVNKMIYDYEIKQKNKEDVLYIYLDINQEFAKLNPNKKKKKLESLISEYIKKNRIVFQGTTVAILISGFVVGSFTLKNPISLEKKEHNFQNYSISSIIKYEEKNPVFSTQEIKEEKEKQDNQQETQSTLQQEWHSQKENYSSKKEPSKDNISLSVNDNKKEETIEKNYVTIYRTNGNVLKLELEEYVFGVVSAEMPASFHIEALKAQAILARTYALKSLKINRKLTDNSTTQNYKSKEELKKIWGNLYSTYSKKIKNAVDSTKGIYLTYKGEIIDAVYHSTSNGKTESVKNVWGNIVPYLVSVESPYDETNKTFQQEKVFTYEELSKKLGYAVTNESNLTIERKTEGNRVAEILIDQKNYDGVALRNLLGLRSATFEIIKKEDKVLFNTYGYGHGVGMSQYGANGMAKEGDNYKEILKHFYQGVTLSHS